MDVQPFLGGTGHLPNGDTVWRDTAKEVYRMRRKSERHTSLRPGVWDFGRRVLSFFAKKKKHTKKKQRRLQPYRIWGRSIMAS